MNDATYSVAVNPWLMCALGLTLRVFLVGIPWASLVPFKHREGTDRKWCWLIRGVLSLVIGMLLALLSALVLAESGTYVPRIEWAVLVALGLAGSVTGLVTDRRRFSQHALHSLPVVIGCFLASMVVMILPHRGEWILGGWDPGVYLNQGVYVEQTGTFRPEPVPVYAELEEEELAHFTRGTDRYTECFPGVPLHPGTQAYEHYFFRLTPTAIAMLARCGGLRAATRVNGFMGAFALIAFFTFLLLNSKKRSLAVFSTLLLAIHPLWLYHSHEPTSEVLHLLLLMGIPILLAFSATRIVRMIFIPLLIMGMMLNRLSFTPFAGMILLAMAWIDHGRTDRWQVLLERAAQTVAVVLGVVLDVTLCSVTLDRRGEVLPLLVGIGLILVIAAFVLDAAFWSRRIHYLLIRIPRWLWAIATILAAAGVLTLLYRPEIAEKLPILEDAVDNVRGLFPFFVPVVVYVAMAGALLLFGTPFWEEERIIKSILLVQLAVCGVVLLSSFVAELYPWATRRHLAYTIPALAVLCGVVCSNCWQYRRGLPWLGRVAAVLIFCLLAGGMARKSWHAWSRTEYDGVSAALAEVAKNISDDDIVIADHPWWGTPMAFIHGKQVLNGKRLWAGGDPKWMQGGMEAVDRLVDEGKPVVFLTSTQGGLSVYPMEVEAELEKSYDPVTFNEIIQHKRAMDFELRSKGAEFRLYRYAQGISTKSETRNPK